MNVWKNLWVTIKTSLIQHKWCDFKENIWPVVAWKAVHYLVHNRNLYKDVNVWIDTIWLGTMNNIDSKNREFVTTIMYNELQSDNEDKNVNKSDENKYFTVTYLVKLVKMSVIVL